MRPHAVAVVPVLCVLSLCGPRARAATEVAVPVAAPEVFAPGVISGPQSDGTPTFSPDGDTLFFTRTGTLVGTIMESRRDATGWSEPEIAPFSGRWNDQHAFFAPDGSYLIFVSTRPVAGLTRKVAHIWRTNRTPAGWSEPVVLPPSVNIGPMIYAPSVAADGTIYFLSIGDHRTFQLYRARSVNGTYQKAEPLPFSSPATADVDPDIVPDQSLLIFASAGRNGPDDTKEHLYAVARKGDGWGPVARLHYATDDALGGSTDNEPMLAPDGKTLYFSSDRTAQSIALPRSLEAAKADLARADRWDDGNSNVWVLAVDAWLAGLRAAA